MKLIPVYNLQGHTIAFVTPTGKLDFTTAQFAENMPNKPGWQKGRPRGTAYAKRGRRANAEKGILQVGQ